MSRITLTIICLMWSLMLVACGSKHVEVANGLEQIQVSETNSTSTFPVGVIVENQELVEVKAINPNMADAEEIKAVQAAPSRRMSDEEFWALFGKEVPEPEVPDVAWPLLSFDWSREITGKGYAANQWKFLNYLSILDNSVKARDNRVSLAIVASMSKQETNHGALTKPKRSKKRWRWHGNFQINAGLHGLTKKEAEDPATSSAFVIDYLLELGFEKDPIRALRAYNGNPKKPATLRYAKDVIERAIKYGYQADFDLRRLYEKDHLRRHRHNRSHRTRVLAVAGKQVVRGS